MAAPLGVDSLDNARAEGFFGTLKEESYNGRDCSRVGFDEFKERLEATSGGTSTAGSRRSTRAAGRCTTP